MALSIGTRLGPYEIVEPLGAGGMGEVYRAKDTRLGREVAIKVLRADLTDKSDRLRRFEQEARTASALNHPNIITIYDIGSADSQTYIAMELIDGKTLRAAGSLSLPKILNNAFQIADGLAKAHAAGIIHRDLKPENIMITKDGFAKILDFGLAKLRTPSAEGFSHEETETKEGTILGTVAYMSPEQAAGQQLDFRSDQFSFGTILYELISGKLPFYRRTPLETLSAVINDDPPPLTQEPGPLAWIIERCLAKDPNDRYESTRDLAKDIKTVRDHPSKTAEIQPGDMRKRFWKLLALILVVALAAMSFVLYKKSKITTGSPGLSYHRLSYRHGFISTARFASDGQTIIYSGAFEGAPRELFLTRTEGLESHPLRMAGVDILSISRAGRMAILFRKETAEIEGLYSGILAEAPLGSGGPRQLADQVSAACWTPDGSKLAIVRRIANRSRLEFPLGKLMYESPKLIRQPRFSSKGDLIAFGKFPHDSVMIINLQGKVIAQSTKVWPDGISWSPKSEEVWFTSIGAEPGSESELRGLSVTGQERIIQRFPTFASLKDVSADGRLLITFEEQSRLAIGILDHEVRNLSWLDSSGVAGLSGDGKFVAIHEDGQGSEAPLGSTYFRRTDGSPAVHLGSGRAVDLARDGKYVLSYLPDPFRFVLFPTGLGETKTMQVGQLNPLLGYGDLFPDQKHILFTANDIIHGNRVYSVETKGGEPHVLTPKGVQFLRGTISQDGKFFLGLTEQNKIFSYSMDGGPTRPILGISEGEVPFSWADDGISIYVHTQGGLAMEVYRVNSLSGKRTFVKKLAPLDPAGVSTIDSIRITPDGRTIAYSYGRTLSTLYVVTGMR